MEECHSDKPINCMFSFDLSKMDQSCDEFKKVIDSFGPSTASTGREWIMEVHKEHANPVYELGEMEVIENNDNRIKLKGLDFEFEFDCSEPNFHLLKDLEVGKKFQAYASHE